MIAVHEISWEEASDPAFGQDTRQAFRDALALVAQKATTKLPECNGRVAKALALVLAGDVRLEADGSAVVSSQCDPTKQYRVERGVCSCKDFPQAPHGFCKHRLGAALQRRALELTSHQAVTHLVPALQEPVPAQPAYGIAAQYVVLIQGRPFVKYAGLLQMAHERGLVSLSATWTYNDAELSLAHAVATFEGGRRFEESGDATPANVNRKVAVHFRRAALTRAKARVLRDALGCDVVAVEELADEL